MYISPKKQMRHLIIIVLVISFLQNCLYAQKPQLQFNKLISVSYDLDSSGKKINITSYREINNGKVKVIEKLYKGISDTTYLLPDSMIERLNLIFNDKQKLRSYLKTNKELKGHYAGSPYFISCTHRDNTIDNAIIESPYLEKDTYKIFTLLNRLPFASNVSYKAIYIKGTSLDNVILKYHKSCTYLINKELPPSEKSSSGPPGEKN
ncbi:hypothetical protein [Mucilaginibacter paludis]|uniref:Uncharacterized protein n=1 Tax=Mucilaginibacter paludis DSM 18603 TaxID=714943 RepID=H1XZM0_9SPHI|nr:hypothetical protein [Mucilaginibacter paludis]EHQ26664.1 hypothetical protein Mucpa_2549 [Mucilaginibacter paludis DSM 18603]